MSTILRRLDFSHPSTFTYRPMHACLTYVYNASTTLGYMKAYLTKLWEHKQRSKYFERVVHRRITGVRKTNKTMDIDLHVRRD